MLPDVEVGKKSMTKLEAVINELSSSCFSKDLSITLPQVLTENSMILDPTPTDSMLNLESDLRVFDY